MQIRKQYTQVYIVSWQTRCFSSRDDLINDNLGNSEAFKGALTEIFLKNAKSLIPNNVGEVTNRFTKYVLITSVLRPALYIKDHPYQISLLYIGLSTTISSVNFSSSRYLNSLISNHDTAQLALSQNTNFKNSSEIRFLLEKMRIIFDDHQRLNLLRKAFCNPPKLVAFFENVFCVQVKHSLNTVIPIYGLNEMADLVKQCAFHVDVTEYGFSAVDVIINSNSLITNISFHLGTFIRKVGSFLNSCELLLIDVRVYSISFGWAKEAHRGFNRVFTKDPSAFFRLKELEEYETFLNSNIFSQLMKKLNFVSDELIFSLTNFGPNGYWSWLYWPLIEDLQIMFCSHIQFILLLSISLILWSFFKRLDKKRLNLHLIDQGERLWQLMELSFSLLFFPFIFVLLFMRAMVLTFYETIIVSAKHLSTHSKISLS